MVSEPKGNLIPKMELTILKELQAMRVELKEWKEGKESRC